MVRPAFDVSQLTVAERLELIDALWESLRSNPEELPLSDDELALIEERRAAHARQPGTATPWEEVRARLHADQEADERAAEAATRRGSSARGG